MDKKDFYRELMSQYTFDEEKIRRNAKRRSSATFFERGSKWLPLSTAAAVFVTVFSGYMLLSPVLNNTPVTVPDDTQPLPAAFTVDEDENGRLSASERLEKTESLVALYSSNKLSGDIKVMHITFGKPMTYPEFNLIINSKVSDTGIVRIESVYNDKGFVNGGSYVSDNETLFTAAKIHAPAYLLVRFLELFEFVDCTDSVTDENFEPLNTNSNAESTGNPVQTTESAAQNTQTAQITTIPAATEATSAATTPPDVSQTVSDTAPVTSKTTETEDDTLPPLEVSAVIRIPAEGVVDVEFISDDHFLMLFRNRVALYRIIREGDSSRYEQIASFDANDPDITYTCGKSKTFVILGNDSGNRRTTLFIADGVSNTLTKADVSQITQDASITYAFCNGNRILLKTQSLENSCLYFATKDDAGNFNFNLLHNTTQTVVVNFDETSFVYSAKRVNENNEEVTELFDYSFNDFTSYWLNIGTELKGSVSFVRSPDLSCFAINNNDTGESWIWNSKLGELSAKMKTTITKFSDYNRNIFTDGTSWYCLDGLEIEVISEAEAMSLSFKPDFSNIYAISEVTSDMVKIEIK